MSLVKQILTGVTFVIITLTCYAQEYTDSLLDYNYYSSMSLEELLNTKVKTVSKIKENNREAPGIVTLITQADIQQNHCRDLIDVLNMVPGFTITTDLIEVLSFSSRGLYGFEGRTLIMVDGMQLNDKLFGTYPLSNDFPLSVIDYIEIIRGPGSVMYGGAAELSVINIITKKQLHNSNVLIKANYGGMYNNKLHTGQRNITFLSSFKNTQNKFSLYGFAGEASKATTSDRLTTMTNAPGFPGFDINLNTTGNKNILLGSNINLDDWLNVSAVYKRYHNIMPLVSDTNSLGEWGGTWNRGELFETFATTLTSKLNIKNTLITPGLSLHYDLSWVLNKPEKFLLRDDAINIFQYKPFINVQSVFQGVFLKQDKITTLFGAEFYTDYAFRDYARTNTGDVNLPLKKPEQKQWQKSVAIWNTSTYASFKYSLYHMHLVGGMRYDVNELTGHKLNPRIGITYVQNKLHTKILYSTAYRAPNIANIATNYSIANSAYNKTIGRETIKMAELEIGYQFNAVLFASINAFTQYIEDIIEFNPAFDFLSTNAMRPNGGKAKHGSEGLESVIKLILPKYHTEVNTSYILPGNNISLGQNNIDGQTYLAPKNGDTYFNGIPRFKLYNTHSYQFTERLSTTINLLFYSKRYQYRYNTEFTPYAKKIHEQAVIDAGLRYQHKKWHLAFTVHDIFNEQIKYVSAFDSYWIYDSTPFSAVNYKGQEINISLSFQF